MKYYEQQKLSFASLSASQNVKFSQLYFPYPYPMQSKLTFIFNARTDLLQSRSASFIPNRILKKMFLKGGVLLKNATISFVHSQVVFDNINNQY